MQLKYSLESLQQYYCGLYSSCDHCPLKIQSECYDDIGCAIDLVEKVHNATVSAIDCLKALKELSK